MRPHGRAVIAALAEREGWHPGYAFDGQKTLYAPTSWNHLVESTLRPFAVSGPAFAASEQPAHACPSTEARAEVSTLQSASEFRTLQGSETKPSLACSLM